MAETLLGAGGRPCARYVREEREGLPCADFLVRAEGAATGEVRDAILAAMPGWIVATGDRAIAGALEGAGARRRRSAASMELDLARVARPPTPAPPPGTTVTALVAPVDPSLGAAHAAAYAPGHPDHLGHTPAVAHAVLGRLVAGEEVGPFEPCSRVAVRDGAQVGAAIVNRFAQRPPASPAWLTELFRLPDPALRGLGAALLGATLAAAREDGVRRIGLAVSTGNPARALYERFGFAETSVDVSVYVPER